MFISYIKNLGVNEKKITITYILTWVMVLLKVLSNVLYTPLG